MRPALLHPGVVRGQALNDARLGADGGDGLADIVVQFAGHFAADVLFGLQQPLGKAAIARQLGLQGLVQLAQTLNARPEQQPGQALGQQGEQQIHRVIVPGLAGNQRNGVHQGGDQRPLPAVVPGEGDNRQSQAERGKARQLGGEAKLEPQTHHKQQHITNQMPRPPVHRLRDQRRPERLPDGAGEVVPDNETGRGQRQAAGQGQQQRVEHLLSARPRQGL